MAGPSEAGGKAAKLFRISLQHFGFCVWVGNYLFMATAIMQFISGLPRDVFSVNFMPLEQSFLINYGDPKRGGKALKGFTHKDYKDRKPIRFTIKLTKAIAVRSCLSQFSQKFPSIQSTVLRHVD